jgi:hypothetical protein
MVSENNVAHGVEVVVVFTYGATYGAKRGGCFYLRISRNLSHFFILVFFYSVIYCIYVSPVGFCKGAWSYGVLSVYWRVVDWLVVYWRAGCCAFGELYFCYRSVEGEVYWRGTLVEPMVGTTLDSQGLGEPVLVEATVKVQSTQ